MRPRAAFSALSGRGTAAARVGRVETGPGVELDGGTFEPPGGDSSWSVYERLRQAASE